jgi:hypothetical protein
LIFEEERERMRKQVVKGRDILIWVEEKSHI